MTPHRSAIATLGILFGLAACSGEASEVRAERVILITCDTLRADGLGVYRGEPGATPRLDRFAESCTVYDSAYSAAPLTAPALSSLMTGRLPDELGMRSNKVLLPAQAETIAEAASKLGLETCAIVSNWVLRKRARMADQGLVQGFDVYDAEMNEIEANRAGVRERLAEDTTDAALAWLGKRGSDRFFLWVHYQDPHGPYTPPAEFLSPNEGERAATGQVLPVGKSQRGFEELPQYQVLGKHRRSGFYLERYQAEIRYFDREVGRLLDALEGEDLLDDALVVFSADHGESLGEHGWWFSHGQTLYDELVHVPLLIKAPAGATQPGSRASDGYRRVDTLVGHVDLFATVLAALGAAAPPTHGTNLLAQNLPTDRVFAQQLRTPGTPSRWESVMNERWRLVVHAEGELLFDRAADEGEERDLAASEPETIRELRARYAALLRALPPIGASAQVELLTEDEAQAMDALGYGGDDE